MVLLPHFTDVAAEAWRSNLLKIVHLVSDRTTIEF